MSAAANSHHVHHPHTLRELVTLYADLGRQVALLTGVDTGLAAISALAVQTVPGTHYASITRERQDHFQTLAPTDPVATEADRLQYRVGGGPCVDALTQGSTVIVGDLSTDSRWPGFTPPAVADLGLRSMLCIPLVVEDEQINAALNLYSLDAAAFTDASEVVAMLLATHGALAVSHLMARERADHLERALITNRRIGMALGVVMVQEKVTDDEAFILLRIVSQNSHRKLLSVAEDVIEAGELAWRWN